MRSDSPAALLRRSARAGAVLLVCLSVGASPLAGQSTAPAKGPVAVYLDCRTNCDFSLIRTEITYVNWVRDREAADVHVLLTSQRAGAGGEQFTAAFLGVRQFAGRGDTLTFTTGITFLPRYRS